MQFRQFLTEQGPVPPMGGGDMSMGGSPPPMPPMGGDPMGGPGAPMPPMGGGMPMGGDPMMGGMGGMGGMQPTPEEPPPIPKYANVWDVLEAILKHKPLEHDEKVKKQQKPQPSPNLVS